MSTLDLSSLRASIRATQRWGLAVVVILVGGVFGWSVSAEISGAVIAQGQLVVESNVKNIQHPTGGVIGEILARDGDHVKAGDVLVRLDSTVTRANLAIISRQLDELTAREARLEAERGDLPAIAFPDALTARAADPQVAEILAGERDLFAMRKAVRDGQVAQRDERIAQLREEIVGLEAQVEAKTREIDLMQVEVANARKLWQGGLSASVKLTEQERALAKLQGERAQLVASIAATKAQIAEVKLQILEIRHDLGSKVADELRDVESKIGELQERRVAARDMLERVDIRATQDGVITHSIVHTVGGVIGPGDVLMQIVPRNDRLTVETRVNPRDIDHVHPGQDAKVRFSSFSQRTTPELDGTVTLVSADITTDQRSGQSYYTVRIALPPDQIDRLGAVTLVPGMPVEAFMETGIRKVASYLIKPLGDQMKRVFREP